MLKSHEEELIAAVRSGAEAALAAMGETAVVMTRDRMRSGYDRPVRDTGSLMADVSWHTEGEHRISVGNTLPYATAVHEGTSRVPGRPYLTDALMGGRDKLKEVAEKAIRDHVK